MSPPESRPRLNAARKADIGRAREPAKSLGRHGQRGPMRVLWTNGWLMPLVWHSTWTDSAKGTSSAGSRSSRPSRPASQELDLGTYILHVRCLRILALCDASSAVLLRRGGGTSPTECVHLAMPCWPCLSVGRPECLYRMCEAPTGRLVQVAIVVVHAPLPLGGRDTLAWPNHPRSLQTPSCCTAYSSRRYEPLCQPQRRPRQPCRGPIGRARCRAC